MTLADGTEKDAERGLKRYVRAYERDPSGAYQPISLDFANV